MRKDSIVSLGSLPELWCSCVLVLGVEATLYVYAYPHCHRRQSMVGGRGGVRHCPGSADKCGSVYPDSAECLWRVRHARRNGLVGAADGKCGAAGPGDADSHGDPCHPCRSATCDAVEVG